MNLLILGAGYSATYIATRVSSQCESIVGTTRSIRNFQSDLHEPIQPLYFDGSSVSEELSTAIRQASHIVVSIPPVPDTKLNTGEQSDALVNLLSEELKLASQEGVLSWIGYLSTVGVYGNADGQWVEESTVCLPVSERSILRLKAEKSWQDLAAELDLPLSVFRLAGIYGPDRNALLNLYRNKARRIIKPNQVFNRIHVGDIATAVLNAMQLQADGLFNITDDCPAPPQDVVAFAAKLMGVTVPPDIPFDDAPLTPMGRSFYGENKRVSNQLSKDQLKMTYAFPDYQTGLRSLWENQVWKLES